MLIRISIMVTLMKRMHVHINVDDLKKNINFYTTLFAAKPTVEHEDYAKWMLDDPRINFAISNRGAKVGLDHLGLQTENDQELETIKQRLDQTQLNIESQQDTACCYMRSDKHWVTDPQGIAWESFHSLSNFPTFNEAAKNKNESACCTPTPDDQSSCCG